MRDTARVCHIGDGVGVPPEMYREWVGWGGVGCFAGDV
jgi:hypothetical protein